MTDENPIVEDIRRIREQLLNEYGDDLHALIQDMHRQTDSAAQIGRVVATRGPRPIQPPPSPVKVG